MSTLAPMKAFTFNGVAVAAVTPFTQRGDFDLPLLRDLIEWWIGEGIEGIVLAGSSGEKAYVNREERLELFEFGVAAVKGRVPVIAGTGFPGTLETIQTTQAAAALGVDAALVVTPYYYPLSDEALIAHYQAVADGSKIPLLLYNMPPFTHVNLSPQAICTLAQYKNVVGVKDSAGNLGQLKTTLALVPRSFCVLTGSFPLLSEAVAAGAKGAILAMANLIPGPCVQIRRLAAAGKAQEAKALSTEFDHLQAWIKAHGIPGIKQKLAQWRHPAGWPRRPLLPVGAVES